MREYEVFKSFILQKTEATTGIHNSSKDKKFSDCGVPSTS